MISKQTRDRCVIRNVFSWVRTTAVFIAFVGIRRSEGQYIIGRDVTLSCSVSGIPDGETYVWSDDGASPAPVSLYIVNDGNDADLTGSASAIPKYNNFEIRNNYPSSVNLVIKQIQPEHADGPYRCIHLEAGENVEVHTITLEALPDTEVTIDCTTSVAPGTCPLSRTSTSSSEFTCTCIATGVYPESLDFVWNNADTTLQSTKENVSRLFTITGSATVRPSGAQNLITCTLSGYSNPEAQQSPLREAEYKFDPLSCTLGSPVITADTDCKAVELTCECGNLDPGTTYTFYNENDEVFDNPSSSKTVTVNTTLYASLMYYCRPCNDIYYDSGSVGGRDVTCLLMTTTQATEPSPTAKDSNTGDTGSSSAGLIIGWVLAAVLGVTLIVVMFYYQRKEKVTEYSGDNGQKKSHAKPQGRTGADNTAYTDLKERGENEEQQDLPGQLSEHNVNILSDFPSRGLIVYRKVNIVRNSRHEDAVAKSLSDTAPISLLKLWHSEMKTLLKLPKQHNVVEIMGWCNAVPNLLITELVDGGNLLQHLSDNFSPHKIHQYGNTKRKKFAVPEKGNPDSLPKYALDVSRGLKFLLVNKFIHPGLRAAKVLVDSAGRCKLYDIVSIERAKGMTSLLWRESIPYQWMSPEYLLLGTMSPAGDIWSFGVLLWEIFSYGSLPYAGESRNAVENSLRKTDRLSMPRNCPGAIWQLMIQCWEQSPEMRPKLEEITSKLYTMCNDNKEYEEIPNQRPLV